MTTQKHLLEDETLKQASDADHIGEIKPRTDDDFELPAKACDLGRPEGCESCQ